MTHEQIEYRKYVLQGMASYGGDVAQALVWCGNHFIKLSDSQLYKQAGNSVTVPVIKAIADRMKLP